eukprot:Phypoly_transcript_17549.p1 GENE.Phypoly_transcript_17549~~Phypoly_transcript_17549.p1  ORF type:complete len:213 (+),score=53.24 Phypoly_transcript_17549:130-768(+)
MAENKTSNLGDDISASDESFRAQFDKNHPSYHGGVSTAVPLGGKNVPAGLQGAPDWQSLPEVAPPTETPNYGPEYEAVEQLRNGLGELKKTLTAFGAPVEAIIKLNSSNPADGDEKYQKALAAEIAKRDAGIAAIRSYKHLLTGSPYEKKIEALETLIATALQTEKESKEQKDNKELGFEFGVQVKRQTQVIFSEQKELLEKMKKIKAAQKK